MDDQKLQDYINNAFTEELILNAENHLLNIMKCRYEKHPTEKNSEEWLDYTNFVCRRRCQSDKSELENKWISVEDRLPNDKEIVLVCDHLNTFVSLGRFSDEDDEFNFELMHLYPIEIDSCITHWMPLPSPPKE